MILIGVRHALTTGHWIGLPSACVVIAVILLLPLDLRQQIADLLAEHNLDIPVVVPSEIL